MIIKKQIYSAMFYTLQYNLLDTCVHFILVFIYPTSFTAPFRCKLAGKQDLLCCHYDIHFSVGWGCLLWAWFASISGFRVDNSLTTVLDGGQACITITAKEAECWDNTKEKCLRYS